VRVLERLTDVLTRLTYNRATLPALIVLRCVCVLPFALSDVEGTDRVISQQAYQSTPQSYTGRTAIGSAVVILLSLQPLL
jgi:hypothetical protein